MRRREGIWIEGSQREGGIRGGAEERERRKERGDGEGEGDRKFMKNRVNLAVVEIERRRSLSGILFPIFAYALNIYDTSYHECIFIPAGRRDGCPTGEILV